MKNISLSYLLCLILLILIINCDNNPTGNKNNEPIASFTVLPDTGYITTNFQFDASSCSDEEDQISELQIRWDWENDGLWNTDFKTAKKDSHQYNLLGSFTVKLEVMDTEGATNISSSEVTVMNNTNPIASFIATPNQGYTYTIYHVNASNSRDNEISNSELLFRWDWENDGIWDTEYSHRDTASHEYKKEGTFQIKLQVMDNGGLTDTISHQVRSVFEKGIVSDIDGNVYTTIKIGKQWWMAENLKVTHYCNGEPIPKREGKEWGNLATDAYCYYNNDTKNINIYGLIYDWYAVNDPRKIAPDGWHVSTDQDWKEMEIYLGMSLSEVEIQFAQYRGTNEGGKLKEAGTLHWNDPNIAATNESGFTALAGGAIYSELDGFGGLGQNAEFWTSTGSIFAYYRVLTNDQSGIYRENGRFFWGMSIRCVKD